MSKIALITGASRGLGAALAEQLALRGWHVIALARTTGGLESLDDRVRAHGLPGAGSLTLAPMDVTNDDAMRHLAGSIASRWGGLGFWAHTAIHATALAPASSVDMKDLDKSIATNLRATSHLITLIEPLLRTGKGTALIPDDPFPGSANSAAYGASKAGQIALARAWAQETARIGPKVVIAAANPMPTALRARFHPGEDRSPLADPKAEALRLLDLALDPALA
ncbi:SDR family oxidoreductase [Xinfangfangia sp. D13-10-4-6]|uniref:SDR family NAD(P)-dependent oxidoreductase n=1 Tax=Pseudogemmobacter hezensis TaxID=2737662 RepID=UPI001555B1BB|nr:SDR family oxidoreductase [Pseudogemmobacter hezensis]NPD13798.1 SDR family oxidoreductase [Pseudogemmobacter hezensis]